MNEEDKYWILLSRYLANDLSLDETDELLAWIEADPERITLLQQAQSAWDKSKNYQNDVSAVNTDAAWLKVKNKLNDQKPAKTVNLQNYKWMAIAASLIILCSLSWFSYKAYDNSKNIHFANHSLEKQQVLLPDGTKIWLNQHSEIDYPKGLATLATREVSLTGEAFFDVKHDDKKPFIIHAGETETQVLGTSFNINANEKKVKVAVITGKVSFKKTGAKNNLFLLPGDEGIYDSKGIITKVEYNNTNFLFWKNQTLVFENEKLEMVFHELEKSYQVKFKVNDENLLNQKITTSFKSASIQEVIIILETLLDLKITPSGDAYIVVK